MSQRPPLPQRMITFGLRGIVCLFDVALPESLHSSLRPTVRERNPIAPAAPYSLKGNCEPHGSERKRHQTRDSSRDPGRGSRPPDRIPDPEVSEDGPPARLPPRARAAVHHPSALLRRNQDRRGRGPHPALL